MKLTIHKIHKVNPSSYPLYFFDANVWIAALLGAKGTNRKKVYVNFFDAVINLNNNKNSTAAKILKKQGQFQPKIVMTSLLMSEIFNAYIKGIAYPAFLKEKKLNRSDMPYKNYRNSDDGKNNLEDLKGDFKAFLPYMKFWDDDFIKLNPEVICSQINSKADFNDLYYYNLLLNKNVPIITDDGDFLFSGVEIITNNRKLIRASFKK